MRVSVVIPNRNGAGMIGTCVDAATASGAAEVIVVDDGSTDASPVEATRAGAVLVESDGRGFAAAVNSGARRATGDALLILNSDCFLEREALRRMAATLEGNPGLGICAAGLVEPDRSPANSRGAELTLGLAILTVISQNPFVANAPGHGVEETAFVPLACATVRRSVWDELSGLDERFFFYFEDQDICRRLRSLGWRIAVDWDAVAVHVGGASSATRDEQRWFLEYVRSRTRYLRKHYRFSWPVFALVWVPAALGRAAAWTFRSRPGSGGWARTWLRATLVGISG